MDSVERAGEQRVARRADPGWLRDQTTLLAQWHPTLNGTADPLTLRAGSERKVWWQCEHGHEWQATVVNRARKGSGCPFCAGLRPSPGHNLADTHPEIAATWHPTANEDLTPDQVKAGSRRRVWWQCEHGHDWQVGVSNRVRTGCPFCAGKRLTPETTLADTHPDMARQWHPTANDGRTPADIAAGSTLPAHWLCETCGHQWTAAPAHRTRTGSGCRRCAYNFPRRATGNLSETHPELAAQWHPTANNPAHPDTITFGSSRPVWWQCEHGHSWQARPNTRTHGRNGCPYCAGKIPHAQHNLAVTRPDLAAEWHPTANGDLTPDQVAPWSTGTIVWWRCPNGHESQAAPGHRYAGACAVCSGHLPTPTNNLAATAPEVAAQWHPTANGDLTPGQVTPFSNYVAWWRCATCGTAWQAQVRHRTNGTGCPTCTSPTHTA